MTPFEQQGWTKDSLFTVDNSSYFRQGEIIWLHKDDKSSSPYFTNGEMTFSKCLSGLKYLGEKGKMSRDKITDKSSYKPNSMPDITKFKHTAVVKFYTDGRLYGKEYHYLCDDSILRKYIDSDGPFDHTAIVSGESKKISVRSVLPNYLSEKATKALPEVAFTSPILTDSVKIKVTVSNPNELKVGSRVKIRKGTRYYGNSTRNPAEVEGTVNEIKSSGWFHVIWDNEESEDYEYPDLELVENKVEKDLKISSSNAKVESSASQSVKLVWDKEYLMRVGGYWKMPDNMGVSETDVKLKQEDVNMGVRRTVTIELIDDDKGLDVSDALVASYENVLIETDTESAIREILMTKNVAKKLEEHNVKRMATVDLDILNRTGNEVKLRSVQLNQLRWNVK